MLCHPLSWMLEAAYDTYSIRSAMIVTVEKGIVT